MSKLLVRVGVCASLCLGLLTAARWQAPTLAVSAASTPISNAQAAAEHPPSGPTKLLRYADISKDAVVFSYAGDLWSASRQGGAAHRLTSGPGDKLYPKFSPAGQSTPFPGSYDGNPEFYVTPAAGGEPRRLTFHPTN